VRSSHSSGHGQADHSGHYPTTPILTSISAIRGITRTVTYVTDWHSYSMGYNQFNPPDVTFINLPLLEGHVTRDVIPRLAESVHTPLQEPKHRLLTNLIGDVTCRKNNAADCTPEKRIL